MEDVFIISDNIFSPLGETTEENFGQLKNGISGIKQHNDLTKSALPFFASMFEKDICFLNGSSANQYTKFERMLIISIRDALKDSEVNLRDGKTVLVISSTKGNISLLENEKLNPELKDRISLSYSASRVADYFQYKQPPVIISNACISSLVAMLIAKRLIQSGQYENAVIAGADVISRFILSGFESFQAISSSPCKPFDADRNGINLGEAAATIVLSSNKKLSGSRITFAGGSISNDANHISGPSMTGEELNQAIQNAMKEARLSSDEIDFISAHGTATVYNDEMEAKALALAEMISVPVNSLKGYFGHTLGAAGLLESIISIHSMEENVVIPSKGMDRLGVSFPLNICSSLLPASLTHCLKTASGFGGCNAAVVFSKC